VNEEPVQLPLNMVQELTCVPAQLFFLKYAILLSQLAKPEAEGMIKPLGSTVDGIKFNDTEPEQLEGA
jgi:hypothetical protein